MATQARQDKVSLYHRFSEENQTPKVQTQTFWLGKSLEQHLHLILTLPCFSEELYLFKIVSQKHKVDTAESQLSDNEEKVHDVPAEGTEEYKDHQIQRFPRR